MKNLINMDQDKLIIMSLYGIVLVLYGIYVGIGLQLSTEDLEYSTLLDQIAAAKRENVILNDQYLESAAYGNLYWKAQKEQGFRPITDQDYYLLK